MLCPPRLLAVKMIWISTLKMASGSILEHLVEGQKSKKFLVVFKSAEKNKKTN